MKHWLGIALIVTIISTLGTGAALAQTSTPTPTVTLTPSPTNTLTNEERAQLSTIAPPRQCGTIFTPCGALPWSVPIFPTAAIASPTIRPTVPSPTPIPMTATPNPTATTSGTPGTPVATSTPVSGGIDINGISTLVGGFNNSASTLAAVGNTPIEVSGTPQGIGQLAAGMGGDIGTLFSAMRGVQAATNNHVLGGIGFIFLVLIFVLLVKLATLFLPVILSFIHLLLQVIQTLKPF